MKSSLRGGPLGKFDWCLQGRDAALSPAVKALGLSYEPKAVYKFYNDASEIENKPGPPIDEFLSIPDEYHCLLLWDDFSVYVHRSRFLPSQRTFSLFFAEQRRTKKMTKPWLITCRSLAPVSTLRSSGPTTPGWLLKPAGMLDTETSPL